MGSDSISCSPAPALPKDLVKKKRTNRLAKLRQSKLDVRREQWLSQVKSKGCKVDSNEKGKSPPCIQITSEQNRSLDNLEMRSRGRCNKDLRIHNSDLESLMNSPNLNGSKNLSNSGSSGHCCFGSISEEEIDDECLDDWEAIADALNADDNQVNSSSDSLSKPDIRFGSPDPELPNKNPGNDLLKTEIKNMVPRSHGNCRAWRPDDTFRPQCLPDLSKRHNFPVSSDRHCGRGAIAWAWQSIMAQPSSCPICYEELDMTDASFLPCSCGFRLCLFCHKRILEADERCPGCRKQYDTVNGDISFNGGVITFRVAQL
ncbi:uncharacterized protein LOC107415431 isoform X2 [Ziziphus jujuba]|uniref:Uncharacterized protein LOC107415431 isoform X2 n=1 Tax=Ziziphus jujuba TaxID=326968 RepID=A0A6P3ZHT3_ZIZJJ|nr:uncharacterized protein LOC107415431 isoform X2 [Ziziphus jujuba]